MKIQLLIASEDKDYCQHLSHVLADRYADTFEVSICSAQDKLASTLTGHRYDVALLSARMAQNAQLEKVTLPLLLWDDASAEKVDGELASVRKYQRISHLTGDVLGRYAKVAGRKRLPDSERVQICTVWSPAGGTGKTTTALAYAAQQVAAGRKTVYFDLEYFSSVSVYFPADGKSISEAFENLGGNLELLLQSIRCQDAGSGIYYFCAPSNYDDMNILTWENIEELVLAAGQGVDEVVLDLSSVCDERCQRVMALADRILLVTDSTPRCLAKLQQFQTQSNLFEQFREKITLVCNMGAQVTLPVAHTVTLPSLRADNPSSIYKSLSAHKFQAQ